MAASLTVPEVAEAAAVPVIDDIRGRVVEVYVSLKPGFSPSKEMKDNRREVPNVRHGPCEMIHSGNRKKRR